MGFLESLGLKRIALKGDKQHVPLLGVTVPGDVTPGASLPAVTTPAAVVPADVALAVTPPGGTAPLTGFRERAPHLISDFYPIREFSLLKRENRQGFGR